MIVQNAIAIVSPDQRQPLRVRGACGLIAVTTIAIAEHGERHHVEAAGAEIQHRPQRGVTQRDKEFASRARRWCVDLWWPTGRPGSTHPARRRRGCVRCGVRGVTWRIFGYLVRMTRRRDAALGSAAGGVLAARPARAAARRRHPARRVALTVAHWLVISWARAQAVRAQLAGDLPVRAEVPGRDRSPLEAIADSQAARAERAFAKHAAELSRGRAAGRREGT